jgi:hypothetical protein
MFARLPVGPAIRWLEALASSEPKVVLDFAKKRLGEGGYRDAIAALRRVRELKLDAAQERAADQYEGYAKYQTIVQSYYASPLYRNAKRWLEERK